MVFSIEDKVFLVTGGAAGVGAGVVRALLAENARHVAFVDIAEREGAALEMELLNKFGALRSKFIKCDISDDAQLLAAYRLLLDKYRRLDVVINNAGVLNPDENLYKQVIDINFTAVVSSTYKALQMMGPGGGTVLNVSSLLALKYNSHLPLYAATKTAVLQFTNSIGAQRCYSKTGIRVLSVCLGPTDTPIIYRHDLQKFDKDCAKSFSSKAPERQRVESAVTGMLEVLARGDSGSTWVVADDKPAVDITSNIQQAFDSVTNNIDNALFKEL